MGHKSGDRIYQYLPPQPARIHSFAYLCQPDEIKKFSRSFGFLNILTNAALPVPPEEVIAAALGRWLKRRTTAALSWWRRAKIS